LASNSLLEAVAYAYYAANSVVNKSLNNSVGKSECSLKKENSINNFNHSELICEVQRLMTQAYHHRIDEEVLTTIENKIQHLIKKYHPLFLFSNKSVQEIRNRLELALLFVKQWKAERNVSAKVN